MSKERFDCVVSKERLRQLKKKMLADALGDVLFEYLMQVVQTKYM